MFPSLGHQRNWQIAARIMCVLTHCLKNFQSSDGGTVYCLIRAQNQKCNLPDTQAHFFPALWKPLSVQQLFLILFGQLVIHCLDQNWYWYQSDIDCNPKKSNWQWWTFSHAWCATDGLLSDQTDHQTQIGVKSVDNFRGEVCLLLPFPSYCQVKMISKEHQWCTFDLPVKIIPGARKARLVFWFLKIFGQFYPRPLCFIRPLCGVVCCKFLFLGNLMCALLARLALLLVLGATTASSQASARPRWLQPPHWCPPPIMHSVTLPKVTYHTIWLPDGVQTPCHRVSIHNHNITLQPQNQYWRHLVRCHLFLWHKQATMCRHAAIINQSGHLHHMRYFHPGIPAGAESHQIKYYNACLKRAPKIPGFPSSVTFRMRTSVPWDEEHCTWSTVPGTL